jgi:uncharacterized SAM-binding protein YcdF (DUF218 family)
MTSQRHRSRGPRFWIFLIILLALACALVFLAVTSVRVVRQASMNEARPAGAIVVFGAAEYAGRPSPVYRARLDHAYDLFQRDLAPIVITTGGAARDLQYSEGGVGRDYLIRRGIPDLNLIAETLGDDTATSSERTATILRANAIHDCIAVSDAYHMFRIKQLLQAEGLIVYAAPRPASVPRSTTAKASAALREAISYMAWKLRLT